MVNRLYNLPVWGPGHFNATNASYIDFELCRPLSHRPVHLELDLALERADRLLGLGQWVEAADALEPLRDHSLARPLLVRALAELREARRTIEVLWPPLTPAETVTVGGAILDDGSREVAEAFLRLDVVARSTDASVREIERRLRQRWSI
jgi:hypothetical protein